MSLTLLGLLFLLLVLAAAAVSAMETGLFALKEHHVDLISGDDDKLRGRLHRLFKDKESFVNQALFLSALTNLGVAASALLLHRRLGNEFDLPRFPLALVLIVAAILLADVLPKLLSLGRPRGIFKLTSGAMITIHAALSPLANGLAWLSDLITSRRRPDPDEPRSELHEQELETLVEMRTDQGALEDLEGEIIREIIKLRDKTAKDCMTPRVEVAVLPDDLSRDEADLAIREQVHHRVPVYHENPDAVIGVLDVSAYLQRIDSDTSYRDHIRPPVFVPETMAAFDVLENYLSESGSLVVLLDEFGGFEGIVTRTDIVETLVGDAAPGADSPQEILHVGRDILLVSGSARLDDIGEELGVDLEEEGLATIGGLVFTRLGELPSRGQIVRLGDTEATVRRTSAKRIEELLIRKLPEQEREIEDLTA